MKRRHVDNLYWTILAISASILIGQSIYIPPNVKVNYLSDHRRETTSQIIDNALKPAVDIDTSGTSRSWRIFKNDQEISRYLKLFRRKIQVWTCKNVVEREWGGRKTPPHLDLYCNVIGRIRSITWYHGHRTIFSKTDIAKIHNHLDHNKRYTQIISPHVIKNGQHLYRQWTDVRLRIHNVTSRDSGLYSFRVTSGRGRNHFDSQQIFIYVADKPSRKTEDKQRKKKTNRTKELRRNPKVHGSNEITRM